VHAVSTPSAAGSSGPALTPNAGYRYQRRNVERTTLYPLVRDHLETFYQAVEEGFASAPLPHFVKHEFERFLDCGVLCRGAALLVCEQCPHTQVIALSCKGRGFCPSCLGRRMAQSAANLIDHVLPHDVALRQWVLTCPFELRARLGFDAPLLGELSAVVNDCLLHFYEHKLRERIAPLPPPDTQAPTRRRKLQSGTVTVVQRTSSDLRLNPHLHIVAIDGVFAEQAHGPPSFVQLPQLTSMDVAELLATIRHRLLRLLTRRGVLDTTHEPTLLASEQADSDPALALIAGAAVCGLPPAGPEQRQRGPIQLPAHRPTAITGPLCATDSGFSLHAATLARRDDLRGKEALLRYVLRPPLAEPRLQQLHNGLCRITLKRPFADGTFAIDLDPISLLCRLAAAVPAPGFNTVRYAGVLAPAAQWRPLVIPELPARGGDGQHTHTEQPADGPERHPEPTDSPRRSRWRPWAELLKRSFDIDLLCPRCHNPMKLKSFLTSGKSLQRLLSRVGEPTDVQGKAPARGPPYFASQLLRRRFAEHTTLLDMLD
jgi:hypothetical protein